MDDQYAPSDPRQDYPRHLGTRRIAYPGRTGDMDVGPDHGELTYRGSGRMTGRRALVTGGDSGIGRAVSIAFAREGADVAIAYLPAEEEDARETARWVQEAGRRCLLLSGDVTDEAHTRALAARTVDAFGGLDVLVPNAAHQMGLAVGVESLTTEQLDRTVRTNVHALIWLVQSALVQMGAGSAIVTTASIQAYQPSPALLDYAATKAAIVNLTKNLAQELAPRGIRVNCVAPGPIWTPLIPATMPQEAVESFGQNTPLGRPGQPAEVSPAFVFLASGESQYITGEVIGVTGGRFLP